MQVLEHDDERPILRKRLECAPPGSEGLAAPVSREAVVDLEAEQRSQVRLDPARLDRIVDRAADALREPARGGRRVVLVEDPGLRLDDLGQCPERGAIAVGETPSLAPADHVLLGVDDLPHLMDEPALADTRDADDRHELRDPLVARPAERVAQHAKLDLTADEPGPGIVCDIGAEARSGIDDLPDGDRLRLALGLEIVGGTEVDDGPGRSVGGLVRQDAVDRRGRLQARRGVDDIARCHPRAVSRTRIQRDECLPGRDADTQLDPVLDGIVTDRQRGTDGALGIVLSRDRRTEQRHHRIADEFLDGSAVTLELVAQAGVIGRQDRLDVFRIEPFGTCREPDEIAEHDRHDLAFLARRRADVKRRPAHPADPKAVRVRLTAGSTDHRHRRKGTWTSSDGDRPRATIPPRSPVRGRRAIARGDVAQLEEHRVRIAGVRGSSPLISTIIAVRSCGPICRARSGAVDRLVERGVELGRVVVQPPTPSLVVGTAR